MCHQHVSCDEIHANTLQDGYAVRAAEGAGAYVVGFDALAGSAPGLLKEGLVAYIGTGTDDLQL